MKTKEVLILIAVLIGLAGVFHKPIFSFDIWHHLKMGEYIAQHNYELPKSDPFCQSTKGEPVVHHEWLCQIILYRMHDMFGFTGLRAMRTGLLMCVLWLIFWTAYRLSRHFYIALLVLFVSAYLIRTRYLIRPELFSLLFFTLFYTWLSLSAKKWPPLSYVLFFLICVLWINLHPFMLFMGAIIVILAAAQIAKRISQLDRFFQFTDYPFNAAGLLCLFLLASLINPHVHGIYGYVFHATPFVEKYISEWQSVFIGLQSHTFKSITGGALAFPYSMKGLVVVIPCFFALVLLGSYKERLKWSLKDVFVGLLVCFMAVKTARFAWLLFIPVLLIVKYGKLLAEHKPQWERVRPISTALLWTGMAISLLYWFGEGYRRIPYHLSQQIESHRYPNIPVKIMKQTKLSGKLFNPNGWGGYLIYHLYPHYKPFLDTRSYLHGEARIVDAAIIQNQRPGFEKIIDKYGFDILLFKKTYGDRQPLDSHHWLLVYEDSIAIMYLKKNERNAENMKKISDYYHENQIPFDPGKGFDRNASTLGKFQMKFQ